jgi:hypothetical protein
MNQKMLAIAAIVTAAALREFSQQHRWQHNGDKSETNKDQSIKQKNMGSGDSVNFNCAQDIIKAGVG